MDCPNIFEFIDYQHFIKTRIKFLELSDPRFGISSIKLESGFSSEQYVRELLLFSRPLRKTSIQKLAKGLRLTAVEARFFEALINFNQARNFSQKDKAFQVLMSFKQLRETKHLEVQHYQLFSKWYWVALLEGIETSWAKQSLKKVATSLGVEVEELKDAIESLQEMGLLKLEEGEWKKTNFIFRTDENLTSLFIRNFHREMIRKAEESLDRCSNEERSVQAITISLTQADFQKLSQKITEFASEINAQFSNRKSPDAVYQVNFQVFPLIRLKE